MSEGGGRARRIVLATFGSLGDLHPFLGLARGLQGRGFEVVLATNELHRGRVEGQGVPFHPIRPPLTELREGDAIFRAAMDARRGPEYVISELCVPHTRDVFEDLLPVVREADLLVTHTIVFAGPMAAEVAGVPWASVVLSPIVFFSRFDPPVLSPVPWFRHFRWLGPRVWGPLLGMAKRSARRWTEPVRAFRRELGLPSDADPLFEGAHGRDLVLVMFDRLLGAPQPDWPGSASQTGFVFLDDTDTDDGRGLAPELRRFLDAGPPPIVFTLGSSAVNDAGGFYDVSLAAAEALGRRAVLLIGDDPRNQRTGPLPEGVMTAPYAPYSELFPRAAAVVHQGGVGTTAQALRAGVPMLVVPWAHDQHDNADRVVKLGVAATLSRRGYTPTAAAAALRRLLDAPETVARAAEVGRLIRATDGTAAACDAIEALLDRRARSARPSASPTPA